MSALDADGGRPARSGRASCPGGVVPRDETSRGCGRDAPRPSGRLWRTLLFAAVVLSAPTLHACAVCWGNPDDPLVKGANAGIWVLLSIVGAVQIGFVALFWSFWKRSREQQRFRASLRVIHPFDPVEPSMQRSSIPGRGEQS